ncbi:MAG TPA: reverse transcriptase family protein [Bacteroidales bacterium]|nr:RNA-directed DNA polymerase [Bacteroidales bacterium]HPB26435.1 reverse transcriptase family protein [Bacteroidales bacterium]HPI31308.1 reverse transcriptase family protein [Bacteroidales bacterium]
MIQKYHFEGLYLNNIVLQQFTRHELNALFILTVKKPLELVKIFNVSFCMLEEQINHPAYRYFTLPKKNGGSRDIYAPSVKLKSIQQCLNYYFQAYYLFIKPEEVHGFVINPHYLGKRCNIAENAKAHVKKKYVLNIDLQDFFPNIKAKRVKETFLSPVFNFNEQIATALTLLTTYKGLLPAGAPTSPVISNFICLKLDKELKYFSELNDLTYTRYADDLTFSSNHEIPGDMILDIICIIHRNDFRINEKKLRLKPSNRKQTVTGITVNQKVNVDRKLLKKTRAMIHDLGTHGLYAATSRHFKVAEDKNSSLNAKFIRRLQGYINFIGQVRGRDDAVYLKLKTTYLSLFSFQTEDFC